MAENNQLLYSKINPFHHHHIDVPPRKLIFTRRSSSDMFSDSPKFSSAEETHLRKFLPCNNISSAAADDDADQYDETNDDPYSSDHFRMYEFKVRRCTRSRSHDWTDCPFAHPGEKARRRDPRRFHYSGTVCPEFRQGGCSRGDNCEFAHGVFECWLHPARYRTEACKDGKNCKRKICFFAHTPNQLRILPPTDTGTTSCTAGGAGDLNFNSSADEKQFRNLLLNPPSSSLSSPAKSNNHHCCVHCLQSSNNVNSSPTSTLVRMPHFSPPGSPSPPLSPISRHSVSKFSSNPMCELKRYNNTTSGSNGSNHVDLLNELMSSMESMHVSNNEGNYSESRYGGGSKINNQLWVDVMINNNDHEYHPHHDQTLQQQHRFSLSPSSDYGNGSYFVNQSPSGYNGGGFDNDEKVMMSPEEKQVNNENGVWSCPDLGWVNDLLM